MAEGHAVVRWARALGALVGEPLKEVRLPKRWGERGQTLIGEYVTNVETRGKHLLLHLSNGETLHTHAMQYGSWQIGQRGMTLRKAATYVRLRLVTTAHEAVFFHGPVIELLAADELTNHRVLLGLGPDVMSPAFDRDEAARRVHAAGERSIGDVVLDQHVVAGVGNIFKSEGLFLARIDPRRTAASVTPVELNLLWSEVIPLMWKGTERYGRTTITPPDLQQAGHLHWVYRRQRKPCLRCTTPIEMVPQGDLNRSTYFCPYCQR